MAWPTSLVINRSNFTEKSPDRVLRTQMDTGIAKLRRRSSVVTYPVTLTLFLTDTEVQTLFDFYEEYDALPFDFTHPRTGDIVTARFTSPPQYKSNETMWDASVELEIIP